MSKEEFVMACLSYQQAKRDAKRDAENEYNAYKRGVVSKYFASKNKKYYSAGRKYV